MITPKITGAIITALVIVIGIALLYPALRIGNQFGSNNQILNDKGVVLLTFNIVNSSNMPSWCDDLSRFLHDNSIHSTIFITGFMAERYPACIQSFSNFIDIGSMSYSFRNITSISTYPAQLTDIRNGKSTVDAQGKLNSTLFRAPYGAVDENIYSLLTRSHILADFSYYDHFNLYTEGLSGKTFYRFPITSIDKFSTSQFSAADRNDPLMITFYNYDSIIDVEKFINAASNYPHKFVSASELANMELTIR